jgi:NAD(P)-dependent dehydrogenase (short-subunit alcohol dehydrogenase family)
VEHVEDLRDRVAVVTGAASGIGLALATAFLDAGGKVVLADVAAPQLDVVAGDLAHRWGADRVVATPTDVADPAAVDALADAAWAAFGRVDVVCNNAGTIALGPAWEVPLADYRRVVDVNLFGVVHGIRAFVPRLLAQGGPAHVLNTASMGGLISLPSIGPYVASKHAVVALSEVLAADLAAAGAPIGVSVLCPGYVPSRLGSEDRDAPVPAPAPGEPTAEDVAATALDAIRAGRFYVLTHEGSDRSIRRRLDAILDDRGPATVALPRP